MKYLKKKEKKNYLPLIAGIAIVALAVVAVVLLLTSWEAEQSQNPNGSTVGTTGAEQIQQTQTTPSETTLPPETTLPSAEPAFVATPYGVLYYPANWEESFSARTTRGENYLVSFYGTTDGVELPLFSVSFGNASAEGHLFGTIDDGQGGSVEVRVNVIQFAEEDSWDTGTVETFYAMQDEVNTIIDQIYQLPGFVSAD